MASALLPRSDVDIQWLPDLIENCQTAVKRCERVLVHHLHLRA